AAIVLHLEGKRRVRTATSIRRRRELQLAAGNVSHWNELSDRKSYVDVSQRTSRRQGRDLHRQQRIRRRVIWIGKAKVGRRKRVRVVFKDRDRLVGARRSIVDRRDVDGHGVGRLIQIHAAISRAAIVLHLEGKGSVRAAISIRRRRELQLATGNVSHWNEL